MYIIGSYNDTVDFVSSYKFSYKLRTAILYTVSQKTKQNYFVITLTILGTKVAHSLQLQELHSFSTSPNSRQRTTASNADVSNCDTMLYWY